MFKQIFLAAVVGMTANQSANASPIAEPLQSPYSFIGTGFGDVTQRLAISSGPTPWWAAVSPNFEFDPFGIPVPPGTPVIGILPLPPSYLVDTLPVLVTTVTPAPEPAGLGILGLALAVVAGLRFGRGRGYRT